MGIQLIFIFFIINYHTSTIHDIDILGLLTLINIINLLNIYLLWVTASIGSEYFFKESDNVY